MKANALKKDAMAISTPSKGATRDYLKAEEMVHFLSWCGLARGRPPPGIMRQTCLSQFLTDYEISVRTNVRTCEQAVSVLS
jgi:hypothetical protein